MLSIKTSSKFHLSGPPKDLGLKWIALTPFTQLFTRYTRRPKMQIKQNWPIAKANYVEDITPTIKKDRESVWPRGSHAGSCDAVK